MVKKDLSVEFLGVHFENPFCLSSSPVGNCYDMCKKAYDTGWGGVVFKTIGPDDFLIDEVSPRFDALTKEGTRSLASRTWSKSRSTPWPRTWRTCGG